MSDLRDLITDLGFSDARTLLQSGNLVFRGDGRAGAALEQLLETEAGNVLVFRRTSSFAPRMNGRTSSRAIHF